MDLRPAEDEDWIAWWGGPAPVNWFGYVNEDGLGAIYEAIEGRFWLGFQRRPGVRRTKTAHMAALLLLSDAGKRGISVNALAHIDQYPGSDRWLQRLGFQQTDEIWKGYPVWTR